MKAKLGYFISIVVDRSCRVMTENANPKLDYPKSPNEYIKMCKVFELLFYLCLF
jgi:hypothetical protein